MQAPLPSPTSTEKSSVGEGEITEEDGSEIGALIEKIQRCLVVEDTLPLIKELSLMVHKHMKTVEEVMLRLNEKQTAIQDQIHMHGLFMPPAPPPTPVPAATASPEKPKKQIYEKISTTELFKKALDLTEGMGRIETYWTETFVGVARAITYIDVNTGGKVYRIEGRALKNLRSTPGVSAEEALDTACMQSLQIAYEILRARVLE